VRVERLRDALFDTASEEHAVRQDDRHHAFVFEEMEAVQEEGEVGGGLRSQAVALETHVVGQRIGGFPAQAEGRIGNDGVEERLLGGPAPAGSRIMSKILPMVPPASFIRWRTLSSREPEPQAMSSRLSSRFLVPVFGTWLSSVTMAESTLEICCGV
jgi:hypothetical protein